MAQWTTAYVNDLPDSSFMHIEAGGEKDADGRTTPRSKRHLPVKDADGKVDPAHLRNALARLDQTEAIPAAKKKTLRKKMETLLEAANAKMGMALGGPDGEWAQAGTARYLKDMVHVGKYANPGGGWKLDVTPDRMDTWVAQFQLMRKNGVDVEVVVDHGDSAEDVRGYVVDMFRKGDTLFGVHEFRDPEAIQLAQRVRNVSVLIEPEFVDGKGNRYGEAIVHSSLVQKPVVADQRPFVALSLLADAGKQKEPTTMATLLEKIKDMLGLADVPSEDAAATALTERMAQTTREKTEAVAAREDALRQLAEARKGTEAQDPEVLEMLAEGAEARIDGLVAGGQICPAVAASLKKVMVGEKGKRVAFALSRKTSRTDESVARMVLDALKDNKPTEMGQRTGPQSLSLRRPGGVTAEEDKQVTDEMIRMAGGKQQA